MFIPGWICEPILNNSLHVQNVRLISQCYWNRKRLTRNKFVNKYGATKRAQLRSSLTASEQGINSFNSNYWDFLTYLLSRMKMISVISALQQANEQSTIIFSLDWLNLSITWLFSTRLLKTKVSVPFIQTVVKFQLGLPWWNFCI